MSPAAASWGIGRLHNEKTTYSSATMSGNKKLFHNKPEGFPGGPRGKNFRGGPGEKPIRRPGICCDTAGFTRGEKKIERYRCKDDTMVVVA